MIFKHSIFSEICKLIQKLDAIHSSNFFLKQKGDEFITPMSCGKSIHIIFRRVI